jgi:TM2 domain-containing membrane protein YozV
LHIDKNLGKAVLGAGSMVRPGFFFLAVPVIAVLWLLAARKWGQRIAVEDVHLRLGGNKPRENNDENEGCSGSFRVMRSSLSRPRRSPESLALRFAIWETPGQVRKASTIPRFGSGFDFPVYSGTRYLRADVRVCSEGVEVSVSLGLNDDVAVAVEVPHKSAGLAFLLSFFVPGVGQIYCGKGARGGVTLGFVLLGALLCSSPNTNLRGMGFGVVFVLWVFSFLDAYFTALEINDGRDAQVEVQNPRVAVTLNLLTAGLGYFYLGERTKGIGFFVGTQVLRFVLPRATGFGGGVITLGLTVVQLVMAADAYRIAREQVKEAMGDQAERRGEAGTGSRMPAAVPIGIACLAGASFFLLLIVGLALQAVRGPRQQAASVKAQPRKFWERNNFNPVVRAGAAGTATDLASAVNEIQVSERNPVHTNEDMPGLTHDVRILNSVLRDRKTNADDAMVARYYKGEGLRLMNSIHEHDGEAMDEAMARQALTEFDAVIAGNPRTYAPAVTSSNAQYLAGLVAYHQLREVPTAYEYWEKCAWQGHAGCLNWVAEARITGAGGQKIDVKEALDLNTMVFNTGIRYTCAGASGAMSIAEIVHFTGTKRPGDNELEWVDKAYALMDKVEMAWDNKDLCGRAEAEIEEYLMRLGRGQPKPSLLEDAGVRLDEKSPALQAVVQKFSGKMSDNEFEAKVQSANPEHQRCMAYFDAMWYAQLMKQGAMAQHYHQRMAEIGELGCGLELAYAGRLGLRD